MDQAFGLRPGELLKLEGIRALVVGMEKSGRAAFEFLHARGAIVTAADLKPHDVADFRPQTDDLFDEDWDLIVPSPGVPLDLPALERATARGVNVIGEVELAAPYLLGPVIGITGSNGKTTTTSLVGHILTSSKTPVQVGGNIGTPVIAMTATSRPDQWNVLELSSFQLETIAEFHADIAVACAIRFTREAHPALFGAGRWPALTAHAERCEALPVFCRIVQPFSPPGDY